MDHNLQLMEGLGLVASSALIFAPLSSYLPLWSWNFGLSLKGYLKALRATLFLQCEM